MSHISIANLQTDGSTLLTDAESFLSDLSDAELSITGGGGHGKGRSGKGKSGSKGKSKSKSKSGSRSGGGCGCYYPCH